MKLLLIVTMLLTSVLSHSSEIKRYLVDLKEITRTSKGNIRTALFENPFSNPYQELTNFDDVPRNIMASAFHAVGDNVSLVRVYKINNRRLNDGRAVAYVPVFSEIVYDQERHKNFVHFYYVFVTYRSEVLFTLEEETKL